MQPAYNKETKKKNKKKNLRKLGRENEDMHN